MLVVAPGTLIPRPETSELADLVLHLVTSDPTLASSAWADLGTGSGALAVALARELPGTAPVWALDSNPRAAALARLNARRLGVHDRVRVIEGSWDDPLENHLGSGALSGIVSNPPYVIRGHVTQAEVADHEPASALYGGGRDGGDCLRAVINAARELLKWNGVLALETGGGEQADALSDWMHGEGGYDQIMVSEDSSGARRFLTARYVGRRAA